jgi:hypothetical protein
MSDSIITPLTDSDIEWRPFVKDIETIQSRDSIGSTLIGLNDDELRLYCVSLWEDRRAVSEALHEALGMIARTTAQLDRYRAAVYELRDIRRQREKDEAA